MSVEAALSIDSGTRRAQTNARYIRYCAVVVNALSSAVKSISPNLPKKSLTKRSPVTWSYPTQLTWSTVLWDWWNVDLSTDLIV